MKRIRYTGIKSGNFSIHNSRWANTSKYRENIVSDEEAAFLLESSEFEPVIDSNDPRAAQVGNNRLYRWGIGYPINEFKIYAEPQIAINRVEEFTNGKLVYCSGLTAKYQRAHRAAWIVSDNLSLNHTFGEMELFTIPEGALLKITAHHKDDLVGSEILHCVAEELQKYFFELRLLEPLTPMLQPQSENRTGPVDETAGTNSAVDRGENRRVGQARKAYIEAEHKVEILRFQIQRHELRTKEIPERFKRGRYNELKEELITAQEEALSAKNQLQESVDAARGEADSSLQAAPSEPTANQAHVRVLSSKRRNIFERNRVFGLRVGYWLIGYAFLVVILFGISLALYPSWSPLVLFGAVAGAVAAFLAAVRKLSE